MASDAPISTYRPDVDGLRAIAVALVMGFHAFPGRVPGGFIGVDVFFVISGYLITGLILRELALGRFSIRRFYARRVRRIFPALALLLVVCLAAGALLLEPSELVELGLNAAAGAAFVANLALWAQSGYFAAASDATPLLHLWSLGVEEQFYLVWPVTLAFLFRRTKRLWLTLAGVAAASLAFNLWLVLRSPDAAFYSPASRLWELAAGGLLACPVERRLPRTLCGAGSFLGLLLVVGAAFAFDGSQSFPGWRAMVPVLGTSLTVAAGPEAWLNRALLARRPTVFVGLVSYPLYLWHWPALALLPVLDVAWTHQQQQALKLLLLGAASLAAYLTYRFVERPVRFGRKGSTASLCLAMAVAFAAGLLAAGFGYREELPKTELQRRIEAQVDEVRRQRPELYRDRRCALEEDQDETAFAAECFADSLEHPDRAILLWGDSHAMHLAPGLRALGLPALAQFTASSCPPIVGYSARGRPHCASVNRWVLDWARSHQPHTVLLAASWPSYDGYAAVSDTIAELRRAGIPQVIVVGPMPSFREPVADRLLREAAMGALPERLASPHLPRLHGIDLEMRALAAAAGALYASPLELLCSARGCLVAPGGDPSRIFVFDQSHLTPAGSDYLAQRLLASYLR